MTRSRRFLAGVLSLGVLAGPLAYGAGDDHAPPKGKGRTRAGAPQAAPQEPAPASAPLDAPAPAAPNPTAPNAAAPIGTAPSSAAAGSAAPKTASAPALEPAKRAAPAPMPPGAPAPNATAKGAPAPASNASAPAQPPAAAEAPYLPVAEIVPTREPGPPSAAANVNFRLLELFNVEQLPGTGTLTFGWGDRSEVISLGPDSGYYAMGLVFKGGGLPEQYGKDFRGSQILQVAFGSMRSKLQGQIPQFAAATVILNELPEKKRKIPFVVPSTKENPLEEMAFLLVTSPTTPNERTDEEKLKTTYFAQGGTISFTPKGSAKVIESKSQGKRYAFKMRIYRVDIEASLTTPFNAQPSTLRGSIEFGLYWPNNKEAKILTQKIASESLESTASLNGPEGLTQHSRDVAGSTRGDAQRR